MPTAPIETTGPSDLAASRKRGRLRLVRWIVSTLALMATLWFMGVQIRMALADLRDRPFTFHVQWALISAAFYAIGMTFISSSWYFVLQDRIRAIGLSIQIPLSESVRTYLISQVGKYVPGKGFVLVLRYGLLRSKGATLGLLTLSTVFETFCCMASASLVGLLFLVLPTAPALKEALEETEWFLPMAILFAVGFSLVVSPPFFALLPRIFSLVVPAAKRHADDWIKWSTYANSLAWSSIGWLSLGVSFWAAVQAVSTRTLGLADIPAFTAVFSVAYVAGFLSLIPGQLGVREFILIVVLKHLLGGDELVTVSATILSRLVSLGTECTLAGILMLTFRRPLTQQLSQKSSDLSPLVSTEDGKIEHGT
ncbi:YbhN family protein [bacterium]|nr:YbhN family protein [bacterium]